MKKYLSFSFFIVLIGIVFFLGKNLNPFDLRMFSFHDDTQAARISEFIFNLKSGMIPPRIAPHLSFGLGFPIFNYYAPFAYWFTSFLSFIGFSIPMALKLSFLLSIVTSFIGMFLFLKLFFSKYASLLGAVLYSGSTWFAVEIFVRGNLSEVWFIALFPIALFFLYKNTQKNSNVLFVISVIIISFLLTSHNVLSLFSLLILCVYICFLPHRKMGFFVLISALFLSSYFLIPALLESNFTHATEVAIKTNYQDHFLCLNQIWQAKMWEFGGSAKGCENDGMPFLLGKLPIILSLFGIVFLIVDFIKKKVKAISIPVFVLLLTLISIFLTLYQSSFIWYLFSAILSLFQFPWRFLVFGMFGIGYFGAYLGDKINNRLSLILFPLILFLLFISGKYFSKPWLMSNNEFQMKFLSENYIYRTVAFNISEYLTKHADYSYWKSFDGSINSGKDLTIPVDIKQPATLLTKSTYMTRFNNPFYKEIETNTEVKLALNIHYIPLWKIKINNSDYIPTTFDRLGRPILLLKKSSKLIYYYEQTFIEKLSNSLTIVCFIFLCLLFFYKPLWYKLKPILK